MKYCSVGILCPSTKNVTQPCSWFAWWWWEFCTAWSTTLLAKEGEILWNLVCRSFSQYMFVHASCGERDERGETERGRKRFREGERETVEGGKEREWGGGGGRDRETERETEKETETDRQTDKQIERVEGEQKEGGRDCLFVGWLLNIPATCECISGTDLLRQFYVLPHWDTSCRSNFLPHPVTVYWHRADQSQRWPYNAGRLAG